VAVIEWAERLEPGGWEMDAGKVKKVKIVVTGELERRIAYDDFSA
jgi:hypothetical protein